ncbi:hypothetical protein ACFXKJ_27140 [Kitasatospora indigofera]|uniref:hypothetical protein n=1 Tax=Kitasatospora indigofera TaxID=67307 RepID=UPI0036C603A7
MNELDPRGQANGAAGWDGAERRTQPIPEETAGWSGSRGHWRGRLGEQVVIGVGSTIGASMVIWVLQFLAAHVEVTWR